MDILFSNRLKSFQTGIFSALNEKKEQLLKEGRTIYNLSVGTPDFPPAPHVMQAMEEACRNPENYKYSLRDLPELLEAAAEYYQKRFGVSLNTNQIMTVSGSQEGLAHICLALCNPGDLVLVPNPGYPIFEAGPFLSGAQIGYYELKPENGYLPDLSSIPEETAQAAKVMILSYPLNPVCAAAPDSFYDELIAFARRHNIFILHDNAYADIVYDGSTGGSFLQHPGACEVGAEFYSLSKTFNLTGARISFLLGNPDAIRAFRLLRSQIDYGIFLPVQYAAIAALTGPQDSVKAQAEEYERRRNALCRGLTAIGWPVPDSEGSMFAWAPVPGGFSSSSAFCEELMARSGVICTPGSAFGSLGEGYVRFALTLPVPELEKAVGAVKDSGILA